MKSEYPPQRGQFAEFAPEEFVSEERDKLFLALNIILLFDTAQIWKRGTNHEDHKGGKIPL